MNRKSSKFGISSFGISLMVCFSLIALLLAPGTSALAGSKVLKIGMIMPLSGPISFLGVGLTRSAELYFDKINEEGGLQLDGNTYQVKLIVEDSKFDPVGASTAAKKIVFKDGARIVLGEILPPNSAAIYRICARAPRPCTLFSISMHRMCPATWAPTANGP